MPKDNWVRRVTVTRSDLATGDWDSRDRNPIALAIARVLRPRVILYVDIRQEEFYLGLPPHHEWGLLPEEVRPFAWHAAEERCLDELTFDLSFPSWSVVTERSIRKQLRSPPPA